MHRAAATDAVSVVQIRVDRYGAGLDAGPSEGSVHPDSPTPRRVAYCEGRMRFVACLKDRGAKVPADERDRLKFDVRVQSLVEEKLRHQVEEGKAEEKANAALALAIASSIRPASVESGMDSHELEQLDLKPASWVDTGRESVPDGMSPGQRELERARRRLRGYDTRKTH